MENNKKLIFLVDDNLIHLSTGQAALQPEYTVITIPSGEKLLFILKKTVPDLILLDVEMPGMSGYDTIKEIKANPETADIPVIFLTGKSEDGNEFLGLSLGAVDYITKPFSKPILLKRVEHQLTLKAFTDDLEKMVEERTDKIQRLQNGVVFVLADMVENRDAGTGGHIERTTAYLKILIDAILARGLYTDEIRRLDLNLLVSSARLHDAGKITISDAILNKPEKLTDEEFLIMKKHAKEGERIINQIVFRTEEDGDFLYNARLFAGYHHERWDGKGYPYGLEGEKIPLQGRIMALADVYDALISERPYKKALTHEDAMKIICEGRGTQFDPYLTDLFMSLSDIIKTVSEVPENDHSK